ncbi:META domain-containing protein [Arthrobacter gengyunqii]|uniref:META domain-containing protein n=1 Tax=Arthrobacter gengyunqii TaxID=2886940 RepID=A0ABS8GHK1_9MICC|nr:META domain-containing protein [Arthrobacter gengyunqii]
MSRRARGAILLAAALGAGLLSSCAGSAGSPDSSVEGSWGNTEDSSMPSLVFESAGRFSGTDGCNTLMGRWDQEGSSVELTDVTSTLVGCIGVDTWLSDAAAAEVDGETLALFNNDGDPIGTLQR